MTKTRERKLHIEVGDIFHTNNYGDYIIVENLGLMTTDTNKTNLTYYRIRFLDTGAERIVNRHVIKYGEIKDYYRPMVHGKGYLGEMGGRIYSDPIAKKAHRTWVRMISRCDNPNDPDYYNYGGAGVTIDAPWYNFTNFYNDIQYIPGFNEWSISNDYSLDKDGYQYGYSHENKMYSKYTCQFILKSENTKLRHMESGILPSSGYHGVQFKDGYYNIALTMHGRTQRFGSFTDPVAAATIYNYYANMYNRIPNPDTGMSIPDALAYKRPDKNTVYKGEMCKIVDKNSNK